MAKAIMVSIRPEQIEQICGAGAQVEVRKAYTMERGNGSKLYLDCPGGADRQVWIGARRAMWTIMPTREMMCAAAAR